MRAKGCSVIYAPSDLGLRCTGVADLPDALVAAGLLEGLPDPRYVGRLSVPAYNPLREPSTNVLNGTAIRKFALQLAERIAFTLDLGRFPLLLGGDCSILLGSMLALRRRGRYGLFFIDGHADFYSPEAEPNGEVASMELALVTGHGSAALVEFDGQTPLVVEGDVILFGCRDLEEAAANGSPDVRKTAIHLYDLARVRQLGAVEAARQGLAALEANGVEGIWIHFDADALHDEVMPAVDYRLPDGLWPQEAREVLQLLLASPLTVGMEVTIYNPTFDDSERSAARTLAQIITSAFAASTP
jgi:arginase